jgi:UDP-N-acetylmuramyl pentapeptide synthase
VALTFDRFDGFLRVSRARAPGAAVLAASRPHVREVLHSAQALRSVLHVESVLAAIAATAPQALPREE